MSALIRLALLTTLCLTAVPAMAHADAGTGSWWCYLVRCGDTQPTKTTTSVPELDADTGAGALALFGAGALILAARRTRRQGE